MKRILRTILDLFVDTAAPYWEWTWDSEEERRNFIKYWNACH